MHSTPTEYGAFYGVAFQPKVYYEKTSYITKKRERDEYINASLFIINKKKREETKKGVKRGVGST